MEADKNTARPDWLTVAAIAVVTHALTVSIHEALGHGGTCVAVGDNGAILTSSNGGANWTSRSAATRAPVE